MDRLTLKQIDRKIEHLYGQIANMLVELADLDPTAQSARDLQIDLVDAYESIAKLEQKAGIATCSACGKKHDSRIVCPVCEGRGLAEVRLRRTNRGGRLPVVDEVTYEMLERRVTESDDMAGPDEPVPDLADDLEEIQQTIFAALMVADRVLRQAGGMAEKRARRCWFARIRTALDSKHEHLGGSKVTVQQTINELRGK
jgi:hypothetical protein